MTDQSCDEFLASLFPNKSIGIQTTEKEFNASQLEDRNDIILKLNMDPAYKFEKHSLVKYLEVMQRSESEF